MLYCLYSDKYTPQLWFVVAIFVDFRCWAVCSCLAQTLTTICTCCCLQLSSCLISVKYRCLLVGKFVTPICQSKRIYVVLHLYTSTFFFFFSGMQCAPLGVHSTKCRHQSPEWTILSHGNCFIQGQVIGFQVLLHCLNPCSTRASWWSFPVLRLDKFPELTRKSIQEVSKSLGKVVEFYCCQSYLGILCRALYTF